MEMKWKKENRQKYKRKVGKLKHSPKPKSPRGFHPSEPNLAQARLLQRRWACFRQTRPSEKSLNPSPTRLNMRHEAQS